MVSLFSMERVFRGAAMDTASLPSPLQMGSCSSNSLPEANHSVSISNAQMSQSLIWSVKRDCAVLLASVSILQNQNL